MTAPFADLPEQRAPVVAPPAIDIRCSVCGSEDVIRIQPGTASTAEIYWMFSNVAAFKANDGEPAVCFCREHDPLLRRVNPGGKMKRIYIAGPMSGLPLSNYPAFHEAAARLRSEGHHVENPAENNVPEGSPWETYMRAAIAQLIRCDAIVMLPGWSKSRGAQIEHDLAVTLGMTVSAYGRVLPC